MPEFSRANASHKLLVTELTDWNIKEMLLYQVLLLYIINLVNEKRE